MSEFLHFAEHTLQEVALGFMALVYITRIWWLLRFKAGRERQPPTGAKETTPGKGAIYSLANIAMPWAMESTRSKWFFYAQFVVFHLGVTAAITLSFVIPYAPGLLNFPPLVLAFQAIIAGAFLVGVSRIFRRITNPHVRAISTPDDYFSPALLTVWFFFAFLAAPNPIEQGESSLLAYFFLTAFFLVYVPFSKISHYLYYPFTRYYFGKSMGARGVYPLRRGPRRERVRG